MNCLHYFLSDPVSYPQPGDPIPRGCSKELLDRYPGLPDQLDNQMKTMIKIDFEGAAATCQWVQYDYEYMTKRPVTFAIYYYCESSFSKLGNSGISANIVWNNYS